MKSYAQAKREFVLQTRTRAKGRFIRLQILANLLLGLVVVLGATLLEDRIFSLRSVVLDLLVLLPICLLGAYLTGGWKWKEFEKKYPEDSLPLWE